jgi:hypothetical protein
VPPLKYKEIFHKPYTVFILEKINSTILNWKDGPAYLRLGDSSILDTLQDLSIGDNEK